MASLCRQIVRVNALRSVLLSTARRGYADKSKGKYARVDAHEQISCREEASYKLPAVGTLTQYELSPMVHGRSASDNTGTVGWQMLMPDPLEHATGLERKELLALESGNDDPFNMKVLKKAAGTRDNPTLVPSCFDARIVGCICEEHATSINWLWVHKDHPRRCECGHWYKLIEKSPL